LASFGSAGGGVGEEKACSGRVVETHAHEDSFGFGKVFFDGFFGGGGGNFLFKPGGYFV